jgi:hypothetical protein
MKTMKTRRIFFIFALLASFNMQAQNFADYFTNKTLRIDYLLNGDAQKQNICLDELSSLPQWAGRRHRLAELPLKGNGQTIVTDSASGKEIYATSFSSLFTEWLSTDEAKHVAKGFEHTVLVPYPLRTVRITTTLYNSHQEVAAQIVHFVNPTDILIHAKGTSHITPHRYLLHSGNSDKCIDVAILGEGYTAAEMDTFYADAKTACESLFSHEPFKSMKSCFNIIAVASPSADSGVSIPSKGEWKETAFLSHFNTFYSDRYLTTTHLKLIHDALAGIPYEHIIILANTENYGGGGIYNDFTLTAAHHPMFRPVVVHEFGHSFGGLADEYYYEGDVMDDTYPLSVEPWEQNITTRVSFASKWQDMLKRGTPIPTAAKQRNDYSVGLYEGAGYSGKGIYRASYDCRMRSNGCPVFCPVCQRALHRIIDFYTKP